MARRLVIPFALLAVATVAHGGTWTVDDNGPADFASIATAVVAVPAGDTLLVAPGNYGPFALQKQLIILGASGGALPNVRGQSRVQNVPAATLAGLQMDALLLSNIAGLVRIDDCRLAMHISTDPNGGGAALVANNCSQLLVTRCVIDGEYPSGFGISEGVTLTNCTASFTGCSVHGSDTAASELGDCGHDGHPAVYVDGGSARFTACNLLGGEGGYSGCFSTPSDGWGASGIQSWQAVVDVRAGTLVKAGDFDQGFGGQYAALDVHGGTAVLGGGTIGSGGLKLSSGALSITAAPAEPTLQLVPDSAPVPGASGQLLLTAPPTAPLILFVSLEDGHTNLAALDGALWLKLPAPIVLALAPGTTSLPYTLAGGDELIGSVITLQAVCPTVPGAVQPTKVSVTGPDQIIVRF